MAKRADLERRIDGLWEYAQPLLKKESARGNVELEAAVLPALAEAYRELTTLNRKRYCRSASGNQLSETGLQRQMALSAEVERLLARIGYPHGIAGEQSKRNNERLHQLWLKRCEPHRYGGAPTADELEEEARLQERRRILEEDTPAAQVRKRLAYFWYRILHFGLPLSQAELDEFFRLETMINSLEGTPYLYIPSAKYLDRQGSLPKPIASRPAHAELDKFGIDTSISTLIAGEIAGEDDIGHALRKNGLCDFIWSDGPVGTVDRLRLHPYDLLIVNLDTKWGLELVRRLDSEQAAHKPAVFAVTCDVSVSEDWNGVSLLRPVNARLLAVHLRRKGLVSACVTQTESTSNLAS